MSDADAIFAKLRLADLATFLAIARCGSIQGAARSLSVAPSQVSKAVARLERELGARLLVRGSHGVVVSEAGRRLVPGCEEILARVRALGSVDGAAEPDLTIVAPAFLNDVCLPAIASAIAPARVRSLEIPPGLASAYSSQHIFDMALTTSDETWPTSWVRQEVGFVRRALFGSPVAAERLGSAPVDPEALAAATFLAPVYAYNGQLVAGDDRCPLPPSARHVGHQTQTVHLALELAAETNQLVFAPAVAARSWVANGRLREIVVRGWNVREPLSLVTSERVLSRRQHRVVEALRVCLRDDVSAP